MNSKRRRGNKAHPRKNLTLPPDIAALTRESSLSDEDWERLENDPGFRRMMEEAEQELSQYSLQEGLRQGRFIPHDEVLAKAKERVATKRTEEEQREFERRYVEYWRARAQARITR